MMKKIQKYVYIVGGILLVLGAALYVTKWSWAPYMYTVGAFLFGAMQMADRYEGNNFMVRRLRRQQVLGAVMLMLTGVAMFVCLGISGGTFTFAAFLAGAVTNAIPGIIVQLVLVPVLVMLLDNPKFLKLRD